MIYTCLYLHKKFSPSDVHDGLQKQLVRRNSYDEAIAETFPSHRGSQSSSTSSSGSGSPRTTKRFRAASVSKLLPHFGKDTLKRKMKKESKEPLQESEDNVESVFEEKSNAKDDGYTVKRGTANQQNKLSQNKKPTADIPDGYEQRSRTFTTSRSSTLRKPSKSKVPPRMSLYPRRFDNIVPSSRSSGRMLSHHSASFRTGMSYKIDSMKILHVNV